MAKNEVHPAVVLGAFGLLLWALAGRKAGNGDGGGGQQGQALGEISSPSVSLSAATIYVGQPLRLNFAFGWLGQPEALNLQAVLGDGTVVEEPFTVPETDVIRQYSHSLPIGLSIPGSYGVTARIVGKTGWLYYERDLGAVQVFGPTFSNIHAGMGGGALLLDNTQNINIAWYHCQVRFDYTGPARQITAIVTTHTPRVCTNEQSRTVGPVSAPTPYQWVLMGLNYSWTCGTVAGERYPVEITLVDEDGYILWTGMAGTVG